MEIQINVNQQMGGYTFSLSPSTQKKVKDTYPHAHIVSTIFIESDTNIDFENYFGPLKSKIIALLIGLSDEELSQIQTQFVDLATKQGISI